MQILARLNTNGQCISVAREYLDQKVALDAKVFKDGHRQEEVDPASP